MSAANAGMTEMEQAMENLRNSPLRPDQVTKIERMARVDKLQAVTIALGLEIPVNEVEAALWKPAPAANGYVLFLNECKAAGGGDRKRFMEYGGRWKAMTEEQKRAYSERASVDKERERKEVQSWNAFVDQWFAEREHLVPPETSTGAKRKVRTAEELDERRAKVEAERQAKKIKMEQAKKAAEERKKAGIARPGQTVQQAMNSAMKTAYEDSVKRRSTFYREYWDLISPFMPEHCRSLESNFARKLMPAGAVPPPKGNCMMDAGQPKLIKNGSMYEYQLDGLRWMLEQHRMGIGGILGDEMGLGKTLQVISFIASLYESGEKGPYFVCAPLSVLPTWQNEFERWCPSLKTVVFHGSHESRDSMKKIDLAPGKYDVVLTTYEMVVSDASYFAHQYYRYIVLDEAQRIKNDNSLIGQACRRLRGAGRLLITGTPLQNDLHELWCLLNFLFPECFEDSQMFDAAFSKVIGKAATMDTQLVQAAHKLLGPLMLRRLKREVQQDLPPKRTLVVWCPLSSMQRFWYKRLLITSGEAKVLAMGEGTGAGGEGGGDSKWKRLQGLLMQLRKCCDHPYLFPGSEVNEGVTDESIITASAKMQILHRLLVRLRKDGHKVLVYSQFTTMLDIIQDYLMMTETRFLRLDGTTSLARRKYEISLFNSPASSVGVYLLSTRAGALGITLTGADTVIMYDTDWNPTWDKQAHDRAHRIGQKKPVTIYQLVTRGAVEERVFHRAQQKLALNELVLRDDGEATKGEPLTGQEISKMLACGARAILAARDGADTVGNSEGRMSETEIDEIIDKAQETSSMLAESQKEENKEEDGEDLDIMAMEFHDVKTFEGQRFDNNKAAYKSIADEWLESVAGKKRESVSTVVQIQGFNVPKWSHEQNKINREKAAAGADKKEPKPRVPADKSCICCAKGLEEGALIQCSTSSCQRSFHSHCVSHMAKRGLKASQQCPQHHCTRCGNNAAGSKGLLFRCLDCSTTLCADCLPAPEQFEAVDRMNLEKTLGYIPAVYEYIRCRTCLAKQTPRKRGAVPEIKPEWQFSTPVAQTTDKRKAAVAGKLQQDEADPIPIAEN